MNRAPSREELAQEAVIRQGLWIDAVLTVLLVGVAVLAGSLSIIAETLRTAVMLGLSGMSLVIVSRINRGRFAQFDFGAGKLERAQSLLIALAMIAGAMFMAIQIYGRLLGPPPEPSASVSAGVALVLANFATNVWCYIRLSRASHGSVSPVVESERKSWLTKSLASGIVVVSVAVYAYFGAGPLGYWADIAGSVIVSGFMIWTALGMLRQAVPDLLDKALNEEFQLHINRALAAHFDDYEALGRVRTRMVGSQVFVEIELAFDVSFPFGTVLERLGSIRSDLERDLPGSHVVLVPVAASVT